MEKKEIAEEQKYLRAKRRVAAIKGFYIHLFIYILINMFILLNIYLGQDAGDRSFWRWEHFSVLIFWGVGLGLHAAKVFAVPTFMGPKWEERQIQKYIERDERESSKYKQ